MRQIPSSDRLYSPSVASSRGITGHGRHGDYFKIISVSSVNKSRVLRVPSLSFYDVPKAIAVDRTIQAECDGDGRTQVGEAGARADIHTCSQRRTKAQHRHIF